MDKIATNGLVCERIYIRHKTPHVVQYTKGHPNSAIYTNSSENLRSKIKNEEGNEKTPKKLIKNLRDLGQF